MKNNGPLKITITPPTPPPQKIEEKPNTPPPPPSTSTSLHRHKKGINKKNMKKQFQKSQKRPPYSKRIIQQWMKPPKNHQNSPIKITKNKNKNPQLKLHREN